MECQCEKDNADDAGWMNSNSVQMGAFTVVGYLLYRFSQTLPALIRWPIRIFCSLTGLSHLWSWVSRLVGTLRGIQSLCKWLSRIWRFIGKSSSRFKWLLAVITGSSEDPQMLGMDPTSKPGLRLILLGPVGEGRTSIAKTLLGNSETVTPMSPVMESTRRRTVIGGREVTVIDTPDLLGQSLGSKRRAREALRSIQLSSPGPHAFFLVMQAPSSSMGVHQEAAQVIKATLELFGDEAVRHIIPVLVHTDRVGRGRTIDQLLEAEPGGLGRALSLCDQRPELVDDGLECTQEVQSVTRRQLVERVMGLKSLRGHYIHELQRREDRIREELLADMSAALAGKLGHM